MEFGKNVCISEVFYFGKNMLCLEENQIQSVQIQ